MIFIQPGKVLSDKEKLSGGNSDRNTAYLKHTNFHMYLFLWATENHILWVLIFLQMASFWKFSVYKFQPQRKKNKKKIVESRDIWLMFLSRSIERQAGHDNKMLLLIDSMIELLTLYDIITYILWKVDDNVF